MEINLDFQPYRNNPNLRGPGVKIPYTQEMIDEYKKCLNDPLYFIENYVHVIHLDHGLVLMKLHEYQKRMITAYHENRKTIAMTPRQSGKTITAAAYLLWYVIFNNDKTVAILANKQATADEILHRIRLAYENLPQWLQVGVEDWNKRSLGLENNSRIFCAATSSTGIRGKSVNILYLDEIGFVGNGLAEEFFTSVYPTISSSKESKIIMTSTPNGFNHFYKFWNEAEAGINGYKAIRVYWHEIPGRDKEWYEEQVRNLGEIKTAQEVDCEFLGSSRQLLNSATMASLVPAKPIFIVENGLLQGLKIYQHPKENRNYVMTVDVSRGRHLDASAFLVFDITDYPHRIVASFNNNNILPLQYAGVILEIAKKYNNAYLLIEINDVGSQVAEELYYTYEYDNMFWTKGGETLGKKGSDNFPGIRTTKKTKRIGCANLKDIIEKQQLIIDDILCIQELSTFVQNNSGSWGADEGFHDDMVACLWLFAWLIIQPWFVDLTNKSIKETMYQNLEKQLEEEMLPIFFTNGIEEQLENNF